MRRVKLLITFVIICLLVSAVPAAAQDITPPPGEPGNDAPEIAPIFGFDRESLLIPEFEVEGGTDFDTDVITSSSEGLTLMEEQARPALTLEVDDSLVADADPLQPEIQGPSHSMPAEEKEGGRNTDGEITPLTVGARTNTFPIANASVYEFSSAVAHGGGRYMVVYISNGDVYVRVYSNYGAYQNTFLVANMTYGCGYPAIAYDASSGLFLVAFENNYEGNGSNYNVVYAAVSPTAGRLGLLYGVNTYTINHEWYPSVACNPIDGSCMLAYDYDEGSVSKGFYLKMSSTGIYGGSISTAYTLSTSLNAFRPYLAWGRGSSTYMLTFTYYDGTGDQHPMYAHIFDTPGSPAYVHTSRFVVPSTFFPTGHNARATGVAFDPCTQKFVITFDYDSSGIGTDWDVWMAVKHQTGPYSFGAMSVAASNDNEYDGDISFVTDDYRPAACGTMDKLVVTYNSDPDGIRAADVVGNNSTTNPLYTREGYSHHLWVAICGTNVYCSESSVAGGMIRGDLFMTFTVNFPTEPDIDVYGRMLEVADRTYLPLTVK